MTPVFADSASARARDANTTEVLRNQATASRRNHYSESPDVTLGGPQAEAAEPTVAEQ